MIDEKTTPQPAQNHSNVQSPRLEPIEHPESPQLQETYKFLKHKMGKVTTPTKVAVARFPESLELVKAVAAIDQKTSIPSSLKLLIKSHVALLNNCSFCVDYARAQALVQGIDVSLYDQLPHYQGNANFSKAEQAVLAYVEQNTRNMQVDDVVFEALQTHFSEREIIEITWINAIENYYNLINGALNISSDELALPS